MAAWTHTLSSGSSANSANQSKRDATTGLSLGHGPSKSYQLTSSSSEFSNAYFGFKKESDLVEFIDKYDKFVVEVDNRRRYELQVSRAWYQAMPTDF